MSRTYCYEWNDLLRAPRDPYSEAAARRRHDRGELYTAALGDPDAPRVLVEVRLETQWVGLTLLDDGLRRWRTWSFDGRPDNDESITRFESLDPFAALPREAPWSKAWSQS